MFFSFQRASLSHAKTGFYVFTFFVIFLVHCFRWSPQPPFGVGLGRSGGSLGGLLVALGAIWNDFGVFWRVSGPSLGHPVEM